MKHNKMQELLVDMPVYVLLEDHQRLGPRVVSPQAGTKCEAVYGFSCKRAYDQFCAKSRLALTPYPLVKVFLQDQLDAPEGGLHLIVVDAAGPNEASLDAVTMSSVLESYDDPARRVVVSFRLILEQAEQAYRVERVVRELDTAS